MILTGLLIAAALTAGISLIGSAGGERQASAAAEPASPVQSSEEGDAVVIPFPDDKSADALTDAPEDGRPWLIRVNLTDMVISVYALDERGEYTRLIKQFIATGGAYDTRTPEKTYRLQAYRDEDHYFEKFDCWAAYATQISGPIMFHSVIFNEPGMKSMNGSYNQLGRAASHGCIRMMPDEAKWIYDHCRAGTLVEIRAGEADPDLTQSLLPSPSIDGAYPADMPAKTGETSVPAVKIGA
jgi:hypothetical protein